MEHPLFARFPHQVELADDAQTRLEWTTREDDLFLRPAGAALDVVWCHLGRRQLPRELQHAKTPTRERAQGQLLKAWQKRAFFRFWPLGENRELFLRRDYGLLRAPYKKVLHPELLKFELPPNLWTELPWQLPGAQLAQKMEQLCQDVNADIQAALNWQREANVWEAIVFVRGDAQKFQQLLCGLNQMCANSTLKRWLPDCWREDYAGPGARAFLQLSHRFRRSASAQNPMIRCCDLLNEHFRFYQDASRWRVHDCYGKRQTPSLPTFQVPAPSHHQILEAQLLWRDWLQDKVSPAEIKAIIPH